MATQFRMGRMLRLGPELYSLYPKGRTSVYRDVRDELFVEPVHLGERCSAWPETEVAQIVAARAAGADDAAIRKLVRQLHEARRAGRR